MTLKAKGPCLGPKHLEQITLSYTHFIENAQAKPRQHYLQKEWTDGEIGIEWIKHFDRHTKEKANSHWCLLPVDGHMSHYTQGFLQYPQEHQNHIFCYPSHGTHVYQGLDVTVFGILK